MKIIAFVGLPLSGKSTAAEIAREMGIPVVVMGDVVREETKKRGLELTDENVGKVASELRKKEGMDAIAKRIIPKIRELGKNHGAVVVDGIRGIAEVERLKKEFGEDFILIAIECPLEIRFQRALKRKREDDVKTIEDLKKRDERELSWSMEEAIKIADFTIENTSTLEEFKEKVRTLLDRIIEKVEIEIETDIHPTEDPEKVIGAVKNIFPDAEIEIVNGKLKAKAKSLEKFRDLIRRQRILDTVRSEIIKNRRGREVTLLLNKQVATVSKISFTDYDATLSPIIVRIRLYRVDFEKFLNYVAPKTKAGKPVGEVESLWS